MRIICDLHVHSKYSRATSKDMNLPVMHYWAQKKGIDIIGTGDFTHPGWMQSIEDELEPINRGLYRLKPSIEKKIESTIIRENKNHPLFILTSEISCIYTKAGRGRRIHAYVAMPDLKSVKKFNAKLGEIGNLKSDGRPILGLDAKELLKIALDANPEALFIPAHVWTPWFSVFGSKSGFNTLEECFDELTSYIYAVETGLSSDPAMNWKVGALDSVSLVSSSDAHSPRNLGREATVFDIEEGKLSFQEIVRILKERDKKHFLYTIEFFPEEGKYHFDGHRTCGISFDPKKTRECQGVCPQCKKKLTIGVLSRVEELATRKENEVPKNRVPYKSIVPLQQIIAEGIGKKPSAKAVQAEYERLTDRFGSEFEILLDIPKEALLSMTDKEIVDGIGRVRKGKIYVEPGYDGVYGVVSVFAPEEKISPKQKQLFDD